jgi:lipopolysaccharide transport system permease protein
MIRGLIRGRHIAVRLFRRGLLREFSSAKFGYLWNFADPLIIAAVFMVLHGGGVIVGEDIGMPYGVYVVYGMLLLRAFTAALAMPLTIFNRHAAILSQSVVPTEAFILADVLRLLFDLAFYIPVLLTVSLLTGAFDLGGFLLFLVLLPCMTIGGLSLSLMLTPINAIYTDIQQFVSNIQRPLIFICPTFYRPEKDSLLSDVFNVYNPIAILMNNLRQLAVDGTWHSPAAFAVVMAAALCLALLGWAFLHRAAPLLGGRS